MAIGVGMLFGFILPINFRNPLATLNPQDFWRRWHISLSEWLRDVIFMPIYKALSKILISAVTDWPRKISAFLRP